MLDSCGRPLARMVARTPLLAVPGECECLGQIHGSDRSGHMETGYVEAGSDSRGSTTTSSSERSAMHEMDHGRHDRSHQRGNQEEPDLAERRAAHNEGRPEAPSRVHRRARERNADEVHDHQAEADGHAGRSLNGGLVRGEQHDHHEDCRQHDLDEEGATLAHEQVRLLAVPVGAQPLDRLLVERGRGEHPVEEVGPGDAADHLGHDVGDALGQLHAPRSDETERDCRVDVAPGSARWHRRGRRAPGRRPSAVAATPAA